MARQLKEAEYTAKRDRIIKAALKLVYTKGYGSMTIQDLLKELDMAKGTFFHYFNSKQSLLEALVEGFMEEGKQQLIPIINDEHLSAVQKLNKYFLSASRWKTGQKDYLLSFIRVWYSDNNAIVHRKMLTASTKHITPLLSSIIQQGVVEGIFKLSYPEQTSQVVLSLVQNLWDAFSRLMLSDSSDLQYRNQHIINVLAAYTNAIERVLGIPESTLKLIDDEALKLFSKR